MSLENNSQVERKDVGKKRMVSNLLQNTSVTIREVGYLIKQFPLAKCIVYDQQGHIDSEEVGLSYEQLAKRYLGEKVGAQIYSRQFTFEE
jgi:hypothetical protein